VRATEDGEGENDQAAREETDLPMDDDPDELSQNALLSQAIRAIRKRRRMRTAEVAAAMGMPIRTYEHFESGTGRITYSRLVAFARATRSDPTAILAALPLRSPEFAVHCMDNKLMLIVFAGLRDLMEKLGSDIELLEPRSLISLMDRMVKDLQDHLSRRDLFTERWMEEKAGKLDGAFVDEPKRPKKS
jgi:transcriptional regulator with XRE-family HTH domain